MSTLLIALLVIMFIALCIVILIYAGKRRERKLKDNILDYLRKITFETGVQNGFQKHLVHQMVVIDEVTAKLLVIDHRSLLTYDVYDFKFINNIKVMTQEQTLHTRNGNKPETIVTQIGVQFTDKDGSHKLLVSYDHIEHNIYQKDVYDREARNLCEKIKEVQKIKTVET